MAVAANTVILLFWTGFWRVLLPRGEQVSYARMFAIAAVSSAIMNTVPFLAGHASSVVLLVRRGGTTRLGALSVLALDQLGEGFAKISIFLLVGLLTPLPLWMQGGVVTVSIAVATLLVALLVLAHRHPVPAGPARAESPRETVVARLRMFAARASRALDALRSWRRSLIALACVLAMKAAEAIAIVSVQRSFGVVLPVSGTLLVLAALMLATMLPLAPANLGTYEASVFLAYRYLGVAPALALTMAVIQHLCFLIPSVGIGYAFMTADARRAIASE